MKDLEARRHELIQILESATPIMMEGFSPTPGADLRRRELLGTQEKASFRDLVTVYDKRVEEHVRGRLEKSFPGEAVVGEEDMAARKEKPKDAVKDLSSFWLLDPIDGTTNYSRAYPFFCSTAAFVERRGSGFEILAGAVWNPVMREMFSAARGQGAWLNRERLRVSQVDQPQASLLTTGFASERASSGMRPFDLFTKLTKLTLGVRRDGAAALDLAYVASGRIDGYWEWGLAPWDTAAGTLLVQESQGRVSSFEDKELDLFSGEILASNGFLHKWLLDRLKETDDESA